METIDSSILDEYLGTVRLAVRLETQGNKLQLWQNKINGTTIPYYYFKHGLVAQAVFVRF